MTDETDEQLPLDQQYHDLARKNELFQLLEVFQEHPRKQVLEQVVAGLREDNDIIILVSVKLLGMLGPLDPEADEISIAKIMNTLIDLLSYSRSIEDGLSLRRELCTTLGSLGTVAAIGTLMECLDDPEPTVRLTAARALGRLDAKSAAEPLRKMARSDGEPKVRKAALFALILMKDDQSRLLLADAVASPDPSIRANSELALTISFTLKDVADILRKQYKNREVSWQFLKFFLERFITQFDEEKEEDQPIIELLLELKRTELEDEDDILQTAKEALKQFDRVMNL